MNSEVPQIPSHCDNVTDVTGGEYTRARWTRSPKPSEGTDPAETLNVTSVVTSGGLRCHNRGVRCHIRGGLHDRSR